jgi:S-adenosylmethionine decarboxylase
MAPLTNTERDSSNDNAEPAKLDYFVERNGVKFAGSHLLLDIWGARHLDEPDVIEATFRRAIEACGATLLHIHMHRFSPFGGVSGVAVLAESHISIHTWPEREFAAVDIFMCGACDPYNAIPILKEAFAADSVTLNEARRGLVP